MNKKEEKEILNSLYSEQENTIEESERPDFILSKYGKRKFGVEITELFYNESSARLKKHKEYGGKILKLNTQKKYMHKDDITNLVPIKLYYKLKDNEEYQYFADTVAKVSYPGKLPGERLSCEEYEKLLISIIRRKQERFNDYNNSLEYIDLIIKDNEDYFEPKNQYALNYFKNSDKVIQEIKCTDFRKIFFITRYNNEDICIEFTNPEYKEKEV